MKVYEIKWARFNEWRAVTPTEFYAALRRARLTPSMLEAAKASLTAGRTVSVAQPSGLRQFRVRETAPERLKVVDGGTLRRLSALLAANG